LISHRWIVLNVLEHTAPQVGISNRLARVVVGSENAPGTTLAIIAKMEVLYFMTETVLVLRTCYVGSCCLAVLRDVEARDFQLLFIDASWPYV
jgi:hypothetical protein